jgi:hypothetical protein
MSDEHKAKSLNKKNGRTWTLHPGEILREEYLKPLRMTPLPSGARAARTGAPDQ